MKTTLLLKDGKIINILHLKGIEDIILALFNQIESKQVEKLFIENIDIKEVKE